MGTAVWSKEMYTGGWCYSDVVEESWGMKNVLAGHGHGSAYN